MKFVFERSTGELQLGIDFPDRNATGLVGGWQLGFNCRWFFWRFVVRLAERHDGGIAGGSLGFQAGLRSIPFPSTPTSRRTRFFSSSFRTISKPTAAEGV